MSLLPWDLIRPVDAITFVRNLPDDYPDPLLDVLPERQINDVRARTARTSRNHTSASFRSWNAESPIGARQVSMTVTEVKLPPISEKIPLTESERIELYLAQSSGTNPSAVRDLLDAAYDDIANTRERIRNRMSLARADVLDDGKFTIVSENGLIGLETDWGFTSQQKPTASPLWSDKVNSKPIDDEMAWNQYLSTTAFRQPVRAYTRLVDLQNLQGNYQYKQALYPLANPANIGTLTIDQVNAARAAYGFPPITVVEHALYGPDGTSTPLVKPGKFILVCDNVGETQWGITADALDLARSGAITSAELPGLIAGTWYTNDPVQRWTKVSGCGMPILGDPTGIISATVR